MKTIIDIVLKIIHGFVDKSRSRVSLEEIDGKMPSIVLFNIQINSTFPIDKCEHDNQDSVGAWAIFHHFFSKDHCSVNFQVNQNQVRFDSLWLCCVLV